MAAMAAVAPEASGTISQVLDSLLEGLRLEGGPVTERSSREPTSDTEIEVFGDTRSCGDLDEDGTYLLGELGETDTVLDASDTLPPRRRHLADDVGEAAGAAGATLRGLRMPPGSVPPLDLEHLLQNLLLQEGVLDGYGGEPRDLDASGGTLHSASASATCSQVCSVDGGSPRSSSASRWTPAAPSRWVSEATAHGQTIRDMRRTGPLGELGDTAQAALLGGTLYAYGGPECPSERRSQAPTPSCSSIAGMTSATYTAEDQDFGDDSRVEPLGESLLRSLDRILSVAAGHRSGESGGAVGGRSGVGLGGALSGRPQVPPRLRRRRSDSDMSMTESVRTTSSFGSSARLRFALRDALDLEEGGSSVEEAGAAVAAAVAGALPLPPETTLRPPSGSPAPLHPEPGPSPGRRWAPGSAPPPPRAPQDPAGAGPRPGPLVAIGGAASSVADMAAASQRSGVAGWSGRTAGGRSRGLSQRSLFGDTVSLLDDEDEDFDLAQSSGDETVLGSTAMTIVDDAAYDDGREGDFGDMLRRLALDSTAIDDSLTRSIRRVLQMGTVLAGQRLSDEEIQALPQVRFESTDEQSCSICLERYSRGVLLTALRCGHFFHVDCLASWFRQSTQCPLCRTHFDFETW